jgi:putative uncharacterized protein PY00892
MNLREKGAESEDELGKSNTENSNIEHLDVENLDAENFDAKSFDIENLDSKLYNVDSLNEIKSDIKDLDKDLDDEDLDKKDLDIENLDTEDLDNNEESNTVSNENVADENVSNDKDSDSNVTDTENSLVANVLEEQNLYYEKKFGKDSNEYKILKNTPSFTNEWNLGFFGETFEEMFLDEEESIPETISSIENALAENLDKDNTVPIEDENYKVAKESEEKANKESKFDRREF